MRVRAEKRWGFANLQRHVADQIGAEHSQGAEAHVRVTYEGGSVPVCVRHAYRRG